MAKQKQNKSGQPKAVKVPGYLRFIALEPGFRHYVTKPFATRTDRLWRKLHHIEREDATIVQKAHKIGWVQRTKCHQKWVAYHAENGMNFRAQCAQTRKEALKHLAAWLGLTNDETMHILQ